MPRTSASVLLVAILATAETAWAEPPAGGPSPPAVAAPTGSTRPLVTSTLAREAVKAALATAGFGVAQRRSDALVTRIALSALLPDLTIRVGRSTDQSLRLSPTYDDPYRYSEAGGVGFWIDGRATWHLDRLLFDPNEIAVERLRAGRAEAAGKLAHRVLELLFDWQRGRRAEENLALSDEEREAGALRALEAAVTLDLLTKGWFSAHSPGESSTDAP